MVMLEVFFIKCSDLNFTGSAKKPRMEHLEKDSSQEGKTIFFISYHRPHSWWDIIGNLLLSLLRNPSLV